MYIACLYVRIICVHHRHSEINFNKTIERAHCYVDLFAQEIITHKSGSQSRLLFVISSMHINFARYR